MYPSNNHTFRFRPDKDQILRDRYCISSHCRLPADYKVSYTLHYDSSHIDMTLMQHGMTVFTKSMDMYSTEKPHLTLHEAERIVTDAVVDYAVNQEDLSRMAAVLSGLRPWDDGPALPPHEKCYVFLEAGTKQLVHVDRYHDGCGNGYEPGQRPAVLGGGYAVTGVHDVAYKKTRCQIVFVIKHGQGGASGGT